MMEVPWGHRATLFRGSPDFEHLLRQEFEGHFTPVREGNNLTRSERVLSEFKQETGNVLILGKDNNTLMRLIADFGIVSGIRKLRDDLRHATRPYVEHGIRIQELEYQPE
jgi:hypothetical protein